MQILYGESDEPNLHQLWNALSTTAASSQPSLLLISEMPACPQAALAAGQVTQRSGLPGKPARFPARMARPQPWLLGQLPRTQIPNTRCQWKSHRAAPTQRLRKIGRVASAIRVVPIEANHGFAIGNTWWMAGRALARLPRLPLQKGCVQREDLIDGFMCDRLSLLPKVFSAASLNRHLSVRERQPY